MRNYLFELKEGLIISLKAIRANKVRSALTTIGIVIGICSRVAFSRLGHPPEIIEFFYKDEVEKYNRTGFI